MKKSSKPVVRKKPCPYCGKKLQSANKLKWRNNLSRHLNGGACHPYEMERAQRAMRIVNAMLSAFGIGDFALEMEALGESADPKRNDGRLKDVAELNRMMGLK